MTQTLNIQEDTIDEDVCNTVSYDVEYEAENEPNRRILEQLDKAKIEFHEEDEKLLLDAVFEKFNDLDENDKKLLSVLLDFKHTYTSEESWPVASEFDDYASDDCIEFCNSHGLNHVLRECLDQIPKIFSNVIKYFAELDYFMDEEDENTPHIVIRLKLKSEQKIALDEYDKWVDWVVGNIKPEKAEYFTLSFKRV